MSNPNRRPADNPDAVVGQTIYMHGRAHRIEAVAKHWTGQFQAVRTWCPDRTLHAHCHGWTPIVWFDAKR